MEDKKFVETRLHTHAEDLVSFVNTKTSSQFTETPDGKWSVGQNLVHLIKSLFPVNAKLTLREMLFFSVYHIQHHMKLLNART